VDDGVAETAGGGARGDFESMRKIVNTKGLSFLEYEYRPDVPATKGERVVFDGGKIGIADHGDGWIRINGGGVHYDFVGMNR
jgi:hypothetical protein